MAEENKEGQEAQEKKEGVLNISVTDAFKAPQGKFIPKEKTQEELDAEAAAAAQAGEAGEGASGEGGAKGSGEGGEQFTPNPAWNILHEKLGVDIPEDITSENELDVFSQVVDGVKGMTTIHPIAKELNQKLADPEFKIEDWVQQQAESLNMGTLSGEDFLQKALPYEFPEATEDDISEMIEEFKTSGQMKLQEMQLKKTFKGRQAQAQADAQKDQAAKVAEAIKTENERVHNEAEQLFAGTKEITEIYGIPFSEAERNSFNEVFKELITRDEKGNIPLQRLLQSNDEVYRFAYVVLNGAPKIKEALFNAKEGTKAQVWEKLRKTPTPGPGKGSGGSAGTNKPNYKAFTKPQH